MSYKLKSIVVFFRIISDLLIVRNFGIKITAIEDLLRSTDDDLIAQYKSPQLKNLTKKISALIRYNKDNEELSTYNKAIVEYRKAIEDILNSRKYMTITEGEGIKKRNGYKIVN